MTEQLKTFLEEIKDEYSWFLYSYDTKQKKENENSRIRYPFCCLLSAQLISSFLYIHFSKNTKCIYDIILNGRGYGHAWSTIENEIVDFTHFQYEDCCTPFKKDEKITKDEFLQIMNEMTYLYKDSEHSIVKNYIKDFDDFQEQDLLALEYAKKYEPSKDGFMKYLNEAIQIEKMISYR